MAEDTQVSMNEADASDASVRVYEAGYHILPTVKEEEVEKVTAEIRAAIEKAGGSFIAEGTPQMMKLAYPMYINAAGKNTEYDRAYFGWIKFECTGAAAVSIHHMLQGNAAILRSIIFKTVREDTRASARPTILREVKRTDTIASTPKKGASEEAGEVSQEALDRSLDELTKE